MKDVRVEPVFAALVDKASSALIEGSVSNFSEAAIFQLKVEYIPSAVIQEI
jgi:hypothetical protein